MTGASIREPLIEVVAQAGGLHAAAERLEGKKPCACGERVNTLMAEVKQQRDDILRLQALLARVLGDIELLKARVDSVAQPVHSHHNHWPPSIGDAPGQNLPWNVTAGGA